MAIKGEYYHPQSSAALRWKCLALMAGAPFVHVARAASRVFDILTLYQGHRRDFWAAAGKDLLRIAGTPVLVLSLEGAALYGLICPEEGRKKVALIEKVAYQALGMGALDTLLGPREPYLAGCFQPSQYLPEDLSFCEDV